MSKRGITRTDKFPNFMAGKVQQTSADTATTAAFSTPIPRLQTKGGKATVMELLWIEAHVDTTLNAPAEFVRVHWYGGATSTTTADLLPNNPRVITMFEKEMQMLTSGGSILESPTKSNLTSKDGYGYLFAGDIINVLVASGSTGIANAVYFRIYYRFVDIPITEFVGLVQSQQQGTS